MSGRHKDSRTSSTAKPHGNQPKFMSAGGRASRRVKETTSGKGSSSRRNSRRTTEKSREEPKGAEEGLRWLTRYLNVQDEKTYPYLKPKLSHSIKRVDHLKRFAAPFEHICGGNSDKRDIDLGNDGPTEFISLMNAGKERQKDCSEFYDKGQRRIGLDPVKAYLDGAVVFDVSDEEKALTWCYYGGTITTKGGKNITFEGAKNVKPWPYKCAKSVWQTQMKQSFGKPDNKWWTYENRWAVGQKCAQWAGWSKEVLVLAEPDVILKRGKLKGLEIKTDRPPAKRLCIAHNEDKCVTYNWTSHTTCCCHDKRCGEPCPGAGPGA